jgi:hypothetical protein
MLTYVRTTGQLSSWGFAAKVATEMRNGGEIFVDWIRPYLDDELLSREQKKHPADSPKSLEQVERWTEDYLTQLLRHVEHKIGSELNDSTLWPSTNIEFVFSVPISWNQKTTERFRSIVCRAGYDKSSAHSTVTLITEPESATFSTEIHIPIHSDCKQPLLMCGLGSGICEFSLIRRSSPPNIRFEYQFRKTRYTGDLVLDEKFENLCLSRLNQANGFKTLGIDVDEAAWGMMQSKEFQNAKWDMGSPDELPLLWIPILGLAHSYGEPNSGIRDGGMQFRITELHSIVDGLLESVFKAIDAILSIFRGKMSAGEYHTSDIIL